jgi:hypothetical protein
MRLCSRYLTKVLPSNPMLWSQTLSRRVPVVTMRHRMLSFSQFRSKSTKLIVGPILDWTDNREKDVPDEAHR